VVGAVDGLNGFEFRFFPKYLSIPTLELVKAAAP
jgi:hypothetical protein